MSFAPMPSRPLYQPEDDDDEPNVFCVLSIGSSFRYVILSFEVLAVALRQIRIRCELDGEVKVYDLFIRSDNSLNGTSTPSADDSQGLRGYSGIKTHNMYIIE